MSDEIMSVQSHGQPYEGLTGKTYVVKIVVTNCVLSIYKWQRILATL